MDKINPEKEISLKLRVSEVATIMLLLRSDQMSVMKDPTLKDLGRAIDNLISKIKEQTEDI